MQFVPGQSGSGWGWRFALLVLWIQLGSAIANGTSWGMGVLLATAALPLAVMFLPAGLPGGARDRGQPRVAPEPAAQPLARRMWALLLLGHHLACVIPCVRMVDKLPIAQVAVLVLGGLALAAAVVRPPSVRTLVLLAVLVGSLLRITTMPALKIDPRDGDQLPLVLRAIENLLAGRSPYALFYFPWPLPLVYLPVTWLVYLPTYLVHLDIRLTNLVLELLVGAALLWSPRSAGRPGLRWGGGELAALLWSVCFLNPWTLQWSLHNTHPVFWAVLAWLLASLRAQRLGWTVAFAGLSLAASPLGVIVAAFGFAHWLRSRALLPAGLAMGAAGLLGATWMLPFWLWDPQGFLFGVLRWHNDSHRHIYELVKLEYTHPEMTFAVLFWKLGQLDALKLVQAVLVAALLGFYLWRRAPRHELPHFVTAALVLFFVFNPMIHSHYYWIAAVAAMFTLRPEPDCSAPLPP